MKPNGMTRKEYEMEMQKIREGTDDFIKSHNSSSDSATQFTLDMYKHIYAHARVAVMEKIDLDNYIACILSIYQEAGGSLYEEGDNVTSRHNVH
jgi:hypothetical protein